MSNEKENSDLNKNKRLCKRCDQLEASIIVRAEALCTDCFDKYVKTKVIKRMEAFRVRNSTFGQQRSFLLPLSLGVSSITLLHALSFQLSNQIERNGRPGFTLHVLHVQDPFEEDQDSKSALLDQVKERYPQHTYGVATFPDSLEIEDFIAISNGQVELDFGDSTFTKAKLLELLDLLPSATSRADVLSILLTRVIVENAKSSQCESILWGDSTTRLAEKILAESAKGRGFSLPWQVTDGMSPQGVVVHFPMRDLLKKELVSYAEMADPPLTPLILKNPSSQPSASSKNTTIDDLMKQYFESVEESYPSIVANVVRTTGKLKAPSIPDGIRNCKLCGMPVIDGIFGLHGWGGDQSNIASTYRAELCYGCTRAVPQQAP